MINQLYDRLMSLISELTTIGIEIKKLENKNHDSNQHSSSAADGHPPSGIRLIKSGSWKNDAYIDNQISNQNKKANTVPFENNKMNSNSKAMQEDDQNMLPKYQDGSFYTKKNGLLHYKFSHNNNRISAYGRSFQECWNKRTNLLSQMESIYKNLKREQSHDEIKQNNDTNKNNITFVEWLNKWYEIYKVPYNGEKSLKSIRNYIDKNIVPKLGNKLITQIKGYELQEFINAYADRPNTQKKISDILHASLQTAYEDEIINKNPYNKKHLASHTKQSYRALDLNEQTAVCNNAKGIYKQIFMLACCTGIRIGRVLELNVENNFDINRSEIIVFKKQKKGKTETYRVPYLNKLIELPKSGLLFPNVKYDEVLDYFQKLYKSLGIKNANLHSFRHTFISVCYHAGIKDKQIQLWAGHNSIKMTMDIYTHLLSNKENSPILDYIKALKKKLRV